MMNMSRFITTMAMLCLSITAMSNPASDPELTTLEFTDQWPTSGHLVLGVYQDQQPLLGNTISSAVIDAGLKHAMQAAEFTGEWQKTQLITAPAASGLQHILLVGLGDANDSRSTLDWQNLGGQAAQDMIKHFSAAAPMAIPADAESVAHVAYGAKLGTYYFDKYYTDSERHKHLAALTVVTNTPAQSRDYFLASNSIRWLMPSS